MKQSKWFSISVLFSLSLLIALPAFAQVDTTRVRMYLEGYEWTLNPERFEKLGEGVDQALMEIITDPKPVPNYYRFRALEALRLYNNEEVASFLENYIDGNLEQASHVRRAFESLARGFSATQPARVQRSARKLVENGDPHVRLTAARTLRTLDRSAFNRYLTREKESWVQDAAQE